MGDNFFVTPAIVAMKKTLDFDGKTFYAQTLLRSAIKIAGRV